MVLRYAGGTDGKDYEWWREEFGRQILNCDIAPLGADEIDVAITSARIPGANLTSANGTTLTYTTLGKADDLVLLLPTTTPLRVKQANQEALITRGMLSIADAGRAGCSVACLASGNFHSAFFDRRALLEVCPRSEEVVAKPVVGKEALFSLFQSYHETIQREAASLGAEAQHVASQHLLDLAALILGGRKDAVDAARGRGLAAARLEAFKADVLTNLADASLSIARLAQRHRVSVRYIQLLFEREGSTFTEFVSDQRLRHARLLLSNPLHGARKVTDIALSSGFADLSHFNRSYRRRFGETPSETRERVRRSAYSG